MNKKHTNFINDSDKICCWYVQIWKLKYLFILDSIILIVPTKLYHGNENNIDVFELQEIKGMGQSLCFEFFLFINVNLLILFISEFPTLLTPGKLYSCFSDVCQEGLQFCNMDILERRCEFCNAHFYDCFTYHQQVNCTQYCMGNLLNLSFYRHVKRLWI